MNARLLIGVVFSLAAMIIAISAEEIIIQPGPEEGNDTYLSEPDVWPDDGSPWDDDYLSVNGGGDFFQGRSYTLIRFDVNGLPVVASNATIWIFCFRQYYGGAGWLMNLYLPTSYWYEVGVNWLNQPPAVLAASSLPNPAIWSWYPIDLTAIYNQWRSGEIPNCGLELRPADERWNGISQFFSSNTDIYPEFRPKLVIQYNPADQPFRLLFPLADLSPYTTRCVAVLDHDRNKGIVTAYDGETGSVNPYVYGSKKDGVVGYQKADGTDFALPLLGGYDDEVSPSKKLVLFYDDHTGYDYPQPLGTPIIAPADGNLAIATKTIKPPKITSSDLLWRDETVCPLPKGIKDDWLAYHAVFIIHGETGYSTWYLHLDDLEPSVKFAIIIQGYATVTHGQVIGYVGNYGADGRNHLHFGVRYNGRLVDPYGNGSTNPADPSILWDERPQL